MGFFKKKKDEEQADENVTWEDIQRSMNAPEIPEDQPEWFQKAAINPANLKTLARDAHIWENSWFNVETAAVFAGTRIPEYCESCSNLDSCKDCGKNPSNYISAMSANRDCDVLIWSLSSNATRATLGIADGAFIFFDPAVYETLSLDDGFSFASQDLAPVQIGELDIKDVGDDTGTLFFGDANGSVDGEYFFSGIPVFAGKYKVVTWIGYTQSGELAPQALGVYGSGYDEMLKSDLKSAVEMTAEIETIVKGSEDGIVFARMGNNQEHFAALNGEINENRNPFAYSWSLQLAYENDPEGFIKSAATKQLSSLMSTAESLRMRGKRKATKELIAIAMGMPEAQNDSAVMEKILKRGALDVGYFRPLNYRISAWCLFKEGMDLKEEGRDREGRKLLEEAAEGGFTNALVILTWNALKEEKFEEGIEYYLRFKSKTDGFRSGYTADCDSNYALLKLATGASLEDALDIWLPNIDLGHAETILFSAYAAEQLGDTERRQSLLAQMSVQNWQEVEDGLNRYLTSIDGWARDWCEKVNAFRIQFSPGS
jgi:hypothetical protein